MHTYLSNSFKNTFRSLAGFNYRTWAMGAVVSNVGTWMQRTAQDWIVLTQLTHQNASAVGIVMSLQFGPQLFLLPLTGLAADHFDRRKLLMTTQALMGLLALGLGILTISGWVQLWHVYLFALLLGCVSAFDAPARQTFVSDLVSEDDLPNAVALNSTSFNAARLVGPAVAGVLIAAVGSGWVFLINALTFLAVLFSLTRLRTHEFFAHPHASQKQRRLLDGFRYVWQRADLKTLMWMLFLVSTFGLNFPIFISTMAVGVFHTGAQEYGILTSVMAIGSLSGALLAAGRNNVRIPLLVASAATFGIACTLAAFMPTTTLFGLTLIIIGIAAQTFMTSTNSLMQLSTEPSMRGRVMAIHLAIAMGATPIGAPLVGWVADVMGPRWAMGVGALAALIAAASGITYLLKHRHPIAVSD